MSFRDDLLPDIDSIRGIPGEMGVHRYQVWVRKVTWAGERFGQGSKNLEITRLLVGGQDPHVEERRSADVVGGADDLQTIEFDIGPLTPNYPAISTLDPAQDGQPTEITYLVKGPGLPEGGLICSKVSDSLGKPLRNMLRVKSTGRKGA